MMYFLLFHMYVPVLLKYILHKYFPVYRDSKTVTIETVGMTTRGTRAILFRCIEIAKLASRPQWLTLQLVNWLATYETSVVNHKLEIYTKKKVN